MQLAEFELELNDAAEAMAAPARGQSGRFPARHLRSHLREQGFIVRQHFLDRLLERAQAQGIRFDPQTFAGDFRSAPHFRQTRSGYNTRFALIQDLPVLYRMGGPRGLNPVLVGLLPQGALPPSEPIAPPHLREAELEHELALAAAEVGSGTEREAGFANLVHNSARFTVLVNLSRHGFRATKEFLEQWMKLSAAGRIGTTYNFRQRFCKANHYQVDLGSKGRTIRIVELWGYPFAYLLKPGEKPLLGKIAPKGWHLSQVGRSVSPPAFCRRQTGLSRELELEIDNASRELEAEPFFTKVTRIPGIGNKEGHEILTRHAMRGLPLSAAEKSAVELGVIRPDRGGRSYWNFPRSALESLKAAAQPAHALRPTPSATVATALRLIRSRFAGLHRRAIRAASRTAALEWLGEALHLLQDSFSSAHVERTGGTGRIRHIRAFYIRFGWPPLSRAPREHRAPSDPRDDVYLRGALRPEARAAVRASRVFLRMALRHLRAPRSPRHRLDLRRFMSRYLS